MLAICHGGGVGNLLAVDVPRQRIGVGVHGDGLAPVQVAVVAENVVLGDGEAEPLARGDGADLAPQGGQQSLCVTARETGFHLHIRADRHRDGKDPAFIHGVDLARNPDAPVLAGISAGDGHLARVAAAGDVQRKVAGCNFIRWTAIECQLRPLFQRFTRGALTTHSYRDVDRIRLIGQRHKVVVFHSI